MRSHTDLDRLAVRAQRSGWPIALICGISVLFSLGSLAAVVCCSIGLLTAIDEIRRGRRLLQSRNPAGDLRTMGSWHASFTASIGLYFVQKLLSPGAGVAGLDSETAVLLKGEAPEVLELAQTIAFASTVIVAVLAVAFQAWWSARYFALARSISLGPYVAPLVIPVSAADRALIQDEARRLGVTECEAVMIAFRSSLRTQSDSGSGEPPILRHTL